MGKKLTVEVEGVDEIDVADSLRRITESVRSGHSHGEGFKVETVQTENERQLYDAQHVFDFINDECDGAGLVVTDTGLLRQTVAAHYEVDPEDLARATRRRARATPSLDRGRGVDGHDAGNDQSDGCADGVGGVQFCHDGE